MRSDHVGMNTPRGRVELKGDECSTRVNTGVFGREARGWDIHKIEEGLHMV